MNAPPPRVLIIGYGNPGRLDDGLGPALAAEAEAWGLPGLTVDAAYSLGPEDAELVSRHDVAIFVDAAARGREPFGLSSVLPRTGLAFSSHSLGPEEVMGLAHELFASRARGYLLGVRGYAFDDFGEGLSPGARQNLRAAGCFLQQALRAGSLELLEAESRS